MLVRLMCPAACAWVGFAPGEINHHHHHHRDRRTTSWCGVVVPFCDVVLVCNVPRYGRHRYPIEFDLWLGVFRRVVAEPTRPEGDLPARLSCRLPATVGAPNPDDVNDRFMVYANCAITIPQTRESRRRATIASWTR